MALVTLAGAIAATAQAQTAQEPPPRANSAPAATKPDSPQSEREKLIAVQREHTRSTLAEKSPLPEKRMSQILQFRTERRQLVVHTPLKAPLISRRADIKGFGLPAEISYTQTDPADPTSSQLEFNLLDYPDKVTNVRIHLSCQPNTDGTAELSLESSLQTGPTGEHFARVVYSQSANRAALQAFGTASSEDQDSKTVMISEKDFATLREKHAGDLETWLRPVLHRLQQDFVFATDSNAAWQTLVNEWPVNPAMQAKVESLLPDLNSPRWQTRHAAEKELAKLGRDGATVILRRSRTGLSLEQNTRLDELLSRFRPLPSDEVRRLSTNPEFLLDCEYCDDATVRKLAATRLSKILGRPINIDANASEADRGEAIEQLRSQLGPNERNDAQH